MAVVTFAVSCFLSLLFLASFFSCGFWLHAQLWFGMSFWVLHFPGCVGRVGLLGFLAVAFDYWLVSGYCASVQNRLDGAADDHWSSFVQTKPGRQPHKGCSMTRAY